MLYFDISKFILMEGNKMANPLRKEGGIRNNFYLKTFFLALFCAFIVFIPFIIVDGGRFLYYGDFNVQEIPFYQLAHRAVRSGSFGWNQYTDLGVNFIGSYSFYLLGSPFFWLTTPFPNEWIEFMMGPLFMLKFAFAALCAYVYIHRYVRNKNYAVLVSILYAFSGFSIFNVFFFHFHEAMIFFPLMLAALDEYMYKRRRGLFALSVAACCISNYYFFIGMSIFTLIYFFLRLIMKSWKISLKDLLLLLSEAVLGVGMACVLFVPSIMAILQNNRTTEVLSGWNAVVYAYPQRYMNILEAFFFPPDLPARPNFTPDASGKWSSLAAWLPLFGMSGVIGWLRIRRKHWLKTLLYLLFIIALIPILNSMFQLFNLQYYARWFYMLILMMCLATALALEYEAINWKSSIIAVSVVTASIAVLIGLMPDIKTENVQGTVNTTVEFGLMASPTRFWSYVGLAFLSIALLIYVFQFYRNRGVQIFSRRLIAFACFISCLSAIFIIALGKTEAAWPADRLIPYVLNRGEDINLPDARDDNVRIDTYNTVDNLGMFWEMKSINAFHSIVPGSVMDFYYGIGEERNVASRPTTEIYGLRGLTSVKWLFDDPTDDDNFTDGETEEPKMPGWLYNSNANGYDIWENEYYIPMGFSYDYYMPLSDFRLRSQDDQHLIPLRAIIIDDANLDSVEGILDLLPMEMRNFDEAGYLQDCLDRAELTCNSFAYSSSGFTAEISTDEERIVFFSVPYEPGWSATVNGERVQVLKTNVGFMSVIVPQGERVSIEFTYRTPGLIAGVLMSAGSIVLLAIYLYFTRSMKKKGLKKTGKLLIARPFSEYEDKSGARFTKETSMVPLEYRTSAPIDVPAVPNEKPEEKKNIADSKDN